MPDPRAFISFDYDHNQNEKVLFVGQAKNSRTPFSIQDWSAKSPMPDSQWQAIVKEKVNKCNMVIVLVGKYMATASGVDKEIRFAKDQNVPFFGVYVGGANTGSNLPTGLPRNRTIAWDWDEIASAGRSAPSNDAAGLADSGEPDQSTDRIERRPGDAGESPAGAGGHVVHGRP